MNDEIRLMSDRLEEAKTLLDRKKKLHIDITALENEKATVDSRLKVILGTVSNTTAERRVCRKRQSLRNYVLRAMAPGAHMPIPQIVSRVVSLGYVTRNAKFSDYMSLFLAKQPDIKRVARGIYMMTAGESLKSQITLGRQQG